MKLNTSEDYQRPTEIDLPREPVAENTHDALEPYGEMILSDYEDFKRDFMEWLLTEGKNTYKKKGYSRSTVEHTHYKVDESYRWKWERDGEYTTEFTTDDASELIEMLVKYGDHPDRYVYGFEKSIRRLFKFLREERGRDIEDWEHDVDLKQSEGSSDHIKDKFYPEEMNALYEAALKKYSIPNLYSPSITAEERDELKIHLSQRWGIPKDNITREKFNNASSWKVPSIIAVTSDTGLRPIEVGRAKVEWFDLDRDEMVVPADEATKNKEYWNCDLSSKTSNAVRQWIDERETYETYRDEAGMWLTRNGNPYKARSLNKVLDNLMEIAGINERNRKLSWYSFRHGAATAWIKREGLSKAKNQLRHNSIETTEKYNRDNDNSGGGGESFW